ncbi:MAG: hypothetical protein ACR2KB_18490, partial [Chitinophagaceae bacterium]
KVGCFTNAGKVLLISFMHRKDFIKATALTAVYTAILPSANIFLLLLQLRLKSSLKAHRVPWAKQLSEADVKKYILKKHFRLLGA